MRRRTRGTHDPFKLRQDFQPGALALLDRGHQDELSLPSARLNYPVSKDVTAVYNDVALVNTHSEINSLIIGHLGVACGHPFLDFRGATHSIHNADKLSQETVARIFDDASAMLFDLGVY
jgi:hypothetical protein